MTKWCWCVVTSIKESEFGFCRSTRLSTFPDYLMVHLKKFTIGDDWVPKKLGKAVANNIM